MFASSTRRPSRCSSTHDVTDQTSADDAPVVGQQLLGPQRGRHGRAACQHLGPDVGLDLAAGR